MGVARISPVLLFGYIDLTKTGGGALTISGGSVNLANTLGGAFGTGTVTVQSGASLDGTLNMKFVGLVRDTDYDAINATLVIGPAGISGIGQSSIQTGHRAECNCAPEPRFVAPKSVRAIRDARVQPHAFMRIPFSIPSLKRRIILLLGTVFFTATLGAQTAITFTLSGQAGTTALGYTAGQNITMVFTTTDIFSLTDASGFTDEENQWVTDAPGDPDIMSAVTGSALLGTYSRPASYSGGVATGGPGLYISLVDGAIISLGLHTLDNTPIDEIYVEIPELADFVYDATFVQPVSYFQEFLGEYSGLDGALVELYTMNGTARMTITEVTIATATLSTVPEPATTAALVGGVALVWVACRRRVLRQSAS